MLRDRLGKELLFFDGGMGTLLQEQGLQAGELPETWNLSRPEIITEIHREYLDAGSDVVTTNTFGANHFKFKAEDGYSVKEISSEQPPFSHICSIILGIFRFEPTPEIGFIIACTVIFFPSILTVYKD